MLESIILFLLIVIVTFFVYYMNDGDLLCPSCLSCFAFLLCTGAAIYDCWAWDTGIELVTVLTVCAGLVSFVAPATLAYDRRQRKAADQNTASRGWALHIDIPNIATGAICLLGICISFLYIRAIVETVGMRGSWSETMQAYRWHTSFDENFNSGISTPINYSFRFFMALGYAYVFAFVNELVVSKKKQWAYLAPAAIYCIASLGQSSRGQIIVMVFAGVIMFWVLRNCVHGHAVRVNFGAMMLILLVLIFGLSIFVLCANAVGRVTAKTPFDSLMTYLGGSIIGLDQFIAKPEVATSPTNLFGSETLQGIWLFLGKAFGISDWTYTFQLEYRFVNNVNIGNLYTAFRYYLHDFGPIGMCIVSAFQGCLFGFIYSALRNMNAKISDCWRIILLLVYSWVAISVAYLPIADFLFHQYLNPTSLLTVLFMAFSAFLLLRFTRGAESSGQEDNLPSLSV